MREIDADLELMLSVVFEAGYNLGQAHEREHKLLEDSGMQQVIDNISVATYWSNYKELLKEKSPNIVNVTLIRR